MGEPLRVVSRSPVAVPVTLTWSEVMSGALTGIMRHVAASRDGRPNRLDGALDHAWSGHIEGACGELAVGKHLCLYAPASVNTFKRGGDVGALQVRTRSRDDYDLILRGDDDLDSIFVLVTGRAPKYTLRGWCYGYEHREPEFYKTHGDGPGAWFVPVRVLYAIADLPVLKEAR